MRTEPHLQQEDNEPESAVQKSVCRAAGFVFIMHFMGGQKIQ